MIASIRVKEGKLSDYLRILKASAGVVRKEKGCIEHVPAGDKVKDLVDRASIKVLRGLV